jgi:polar amino acid transport system substrate-binding protein
MKRLLLALCLCSMDAFSCTLKVQVHDFPPYSYLVNQQWQGSRVVLSQRLARKLGCQLQYLDVSWGRALLLMQSGELDLMFNLSKTKPRGSFMAFLAPHHNEVLTLAVHKNLPQWQHLSSFAELKNFPGRIAITQGSFLGEAFQTFASDPQQQAKLLAVPHRKAKNELVVKGRADAVIEDQAYLQYAIATFPEYQQLLLTSFVIAETEVYLALSKKSPWFAKQAEMEQAIAELQHAGLWHSEQQP